MAIVTSAPNQEDKVRVFDVPDSELSKYEVKGDKAAQMFPEGGSQNFSKIKTRDMKGADDVQSYNDWCVCTYLVCNAYGCWYERYWCAC